MIVYLNSNMAIYFVEQPPYWGAKTATRIGDLRAKGNTLAVSDLSRMECQVGPLKAGNAAMLNDFVAFFTTPDVKVLPMTPGVFDRAARIRAIYGFETADALHLAAAIEHGCDLFLSNDTKLQKCTDITVEILV